MPNSATGSTPSPTHAGTRPPGASSWSTSPRSSHTSRRCPPCRVTREGMVSVGGNLYSVPLSDLATIMFEPKAGFLLACEPFAQLRPPPPRLRALDGDRQRLPLPDQHDQALSARDPRIDATGEVSPGFLEARTDSPLEGDGFEPWVPQTLT